jgi:hypothetical protein
MAKQFVTDSGVLRRPGAYSKYTVQTAPAGLATTGVLMLVGEASSGPHWSDEDDIEDNAFGPDSLAEVSAKYGSGPLVDAFRGAIAASNDPDIIGSFSRAILVKSNTGTKASAALTQLDGSGTYATMYDAGYGTKGNQNQMAVSMAVAEVVPTTGSYTYIPAVGTVDISFYVNGGASLGLGVLANRTPTLFVSDVDALAGISASGGANRGLVTVSGTIAVAVVSGNTATFTRSVAWAVTPTVGDTLVIPLGSAFAGAGSANVGAYVITAATSTIVTATKLSDAGKGGAVAGTITAPLAVAATAITSTTLDIMAYSPVTISLTAGAVIQGAGKALEICQRVSGTDLLSRTAYELGTTTLVDWVSTVAAPVLIASGAESEITLTAARVDDNISESFTQGGEIPLRVGYSLGTATLTITETLLTTSTGLSLTLSDYSTIQALADYIDAQSGYSASVGTAALGLQPTSALDRVAAIGITNEFGTTEPGRIKMDAHRLYTDVSNTSRLLQFNDPAERPDAGLPAVTATTYLTGGTRGGTTNAMVSAGIAALENVEGNFLVPLFSRDATADIADAETDASSTYTIASVNAAAKAHVLAMSVFKKRKSRQAITSIQDDFQTQQDAAANTASFRVNMTFQNVNDLDSNGDIVVFQPWMAAVKAAGMQSAGFYRPITNKQINISGISHDAGDFNAKSDTNMEDALIAGLMPIKPARTGGWSWESDQTTYGKDDNFVFNSLQAVYCADTIALTTGQRMEAAFVGKSVSDVSAQVALTYLDQIMGDFLRLKLIAPSDDALRGYKNARIRISGNAMLVSVEIKLATGIDFIVIDFLVSPVQQTA